MVWFVSLLVYACAVVAVFVLFVMAPVSLRLSSFGRGKGKKGSSDEGGADLVHLVTCLRSIKRNAVDFSHSKLNLHLSERYVLLVI